MRYVAERRRSLCTVVIAVLIIWRVQGLQADLLRGIGTKGINRQSFEYLISMCGWQSVDGYEAYNMELFDTNMVTGGSHQ